MRQALSDKHYHVYVILSHMNSDRSCVDQVFVDKAILRSRSMKTFDSLVSYKTKVVCYQKRKAQIK